MKTTTLLNQPRVLVLNRNWQAVNVRTIALAIQQVMAGAATVLDIGGDGSMVPVKNWAEWMKLPIRPQDKVIGTVRGPVRVPTVIVCVRFDKVPKKRPKFSARAVRARDDNRCQYTGRLLAPGEGSIDHVLPRSRGGANTFENAVYADKKVNNRKADKTPEEAGLRLLSVPKAPKAIPVTLLIKNPGMEDWKPFLK